MLKSTACDTVVCIKAFTISSFKWPLVKVWLLLISYSHEKHNGLNPITGNQTTTQRSLLDFCVMQDNHSLETSRKNGHSPNGQWCEIRCKEGSAPKTSTIALLNYQIDAVDLSLHGKHWVVCKKKKKKKMTAKNSKSWAAHFKWHDFYFESKCFAFDLRHIVHSFVIAW